MITPRRKSLPTLAASLVLIFVLGACGSGTSGSDDTSGTEAGGGGGSSITIESPEDGAEVPDSFTVELSTDEELSMSDSAALHIHLVYDGNEQEPDMIDSESFDVTSLEPGEHTITASLRDSAHAPTGPEDAITVMVEGGAGDKEDKKESGSDKY
ncbi:MAG: DUF4399 domain-containing protein [Actinomycetota bacterium]|nr:DUF4399 domain-containing protein [Actinomycetota bacterium]